MKQLPHGLQPGGTHGVGACPPQGGGIQQPGTGAAAALKIGGEVQSLHGPHCSALTPCSGGRGMPIPAGESRPGKMPGFP